MFLKPQGVNNNYGEVAEWLKAHAWKACKHLFVSRVRIPLSPPPLVLMLIIKKGIRTTEKIEKKFMLLNSIFINQKIIQLWNSF